MHARRLLAAAASAVMIAGGVTMAVAPAASAATHTLPADCSSTAPPIQSVTEIVADAGDTIVIEGGADCVLAQRLDSAVIPDAPTEGTPGTWTFVLAADLAPGSYGGDYDGGSVIDVNNDAVGGFRCNTLSTFDNVCGGQWFVTIRGAASEPSSATPIPAWVQAYARASANDTCIEGWSPSWAQWPNGGTGGWVCTRNIPSLG